MLEPVSANLEKCRFLLTDFYCLASRPHLSIFLDGKGTVRVDFLDQVNNGQP